MAAIEGLFREIDRLWTPRGSGKIELNVIGSAALMLQSDYERGTKDGDVLELRPLEADAKKALLDLAGKGSLMHARLRFYLDIVLEALPFLPQAPLFHPVKSLAGLRHFEVRALDVADVEVSKLKRFSGDDRSDIKAMADRGLLGHARLVERFQLAVDRFEVDARAEDLPRYVKHLHRVERDFFGVGETPIDLPGWLDG